MISNNVLITIVTPSYNQGQFIEETILSIINQSYKNIEYILVDGGSTDNTMEIVEKYRSKIDIIIHEKDRGQADAINKGFKLAKGELVGWVNSDDILYPDCIEKIIAFYKMNSKAAIYYSSCLDWINDAGRVINRRNIYIKNLNHLLNNNYCVIQPGSFYPKNLLEKVNYLDIDNYYCMDLDLWLKLLKFGEIIDVSEHEPIAAFRLYYGSKTDTGKIKFLMNIRNVLKKHGANWYSNNIINKVYFYAIKSKLKTTLKIKENY